jgi:hypothetical protein
MLLLRLAEGFPKIFVDASHDPGVSVVAENARVVVAVVEV